jgi:hypothetical protein
VKLHCSLWLRRSLKLDRSLKFGGHEILGLAVGLSLTLTMAAWPASALVPAEVSYQGLLLDDVGAPVTATVTMDFELFDAPLAGNSLWTESHAGVQVVDGVYDVVLGSSTPLTAALVAGGTLHLEVTVEGETLVPRQPLLVVPYALRSAVAEDTEQVDGLAAGYLTEILEHFDFDGGPSNLSPEEGLTDVDGDGIANFIDPDNDDDGLSDVAEVAQGSDINLVTPTISGFSPSTADGFEVTTVEVQGTGFADPMTVSFGSQNPTATNVTPTTFDVEVGPQPQGTVSVSATHANGESDSSTYDFFFLVPTITSFLPERFDNGEAGTITVTGQNFIAGMTVSFGGQTPAPTNITPTSFDIAVAGTEPAGPVIVTVTLPNGNQATDATSFEVASGVWSTFFVTSTDSNGDLGGLAGADATCQALAANAGLAGTFQAWLADSTDSPSTRQSQAGTPYIRTDGAVVANDWADLTDGSIAVGVSLDESGAVTSGAVWSNVDPVGGGNAAGGDCGDWTIGTNSTTGRQGLVGSTSSTWSNNGGTPCHVLKHLYCVEQ